MWKAVSRDECIYRTTKVRDIWYLHIYTSVRNQMNKNKEVISICLNGYMAYHENTIHAKHTTTGQITTLSYTSVCAKLCLMHIWYSHSYMAYIIGMEYDRKSHFSHVGGHVGMYYVTHLRDRFYGSK